jgi:hypothetical protein
VADTPDVPGPVRTLAAQMAAPTPMRRGSLSERYVKCSKPGCACAERPTARHDPYYSLTRTVGGRTQSRFVPAAQTARVRQQIAAGQQFRRHVDALWDACEQWADAQLEAPEAAAQAAAKKGASPKPSRRRSSPRSKPS